MATRLDPSSVGDAGLADGGVTAAPVRAQRVVGVIVLAALSFALAQTMVLPALPAIGRALDASPSTTSWLLTGYLISAAVCTPLVGKLGDMLGRTRALTAVLVIFAGGSAVCALAPSIELMIAGRAMQAVAAGVFPLSFGIIRETLPADTAARAMGIQGAVFGVGGGVGLPLSGVLIAQLGTSSIFWLGLLAVPAAVAAHRWIPAVPPTATGPVDWGGALLLSVALVGLLLGITQGGSLGWGSPVTAGLLAVGGLALVAWVAFERSRAAPLIDVALLRLRTVALANATAFLSGFAMFSSFAVVPQIAQAPTVTGYGLGLSVAQSGLLLAPTALASFLGGVVAGRIGVRLGFRATLVVGTLLAAGSWLLLLAVHAGPPAFVVAGALLGLGLSLTYASLANIVVGAVPASDIGVATGINAVSRLVGAAAGSAVVAAILARSAGSGGYPDEAAFVVVFALAGTVGVLSLIAAYGQPRAAR